MKGPIIRVRVQGLASVDQLLKQTMKAYNLTRLRTLAQLRRSAPDDYAERPNGRFDRINGCANGVSSALGNCFVPHGFVRSNLHAGTAFIVATSTAC